ncbi:uncharacterized protein LOC127804100 [Diospyros lotus]|uniref:uncharacterized protein LOC127804100 n=1 Tax=Diospyros lotus TaxID=55363 RepID=UPI0022542A81|nr:uncharacterized protein LOC127804100 [Diospyros lotus]
MEPDQLARQEPATASTPLPVLPRLDRLERLLQLLEEKHTLSRRHSSTPVTKDIKPEEVDGKNLSNALEQVYLKGTLMDRLDKLEMRVLQLGLDMDEGNTSRSSSSTIPLPEKFGHSSGSSSVAKPDEEVTRTVEKRSEPVLIQEETSVTKSQNQHNHRLHSRKKKAKAKRKWLAWFPTGC